MTYRPPQRCTLAGKYHIWNENALGQNERSSSLFRVPPNVNDMVGVVYDPKIKAPIIVDASLPDAFPLIVFLSEARGDGGSVRGISLA